MKKIILSLLAMLMVLAVFSGCKNDVTQETKKYYDMAGNELKIGKGSVTALMTDYALGWNEGTDGFVKIKAGDKLAGLGITNASSRYSYDFSSNAGFVCDMCSYTLANYDSENFVNNPFTLKGVLIVDGDYLSFMPNRAENKADDFYLLQKNFDYNQNSFDAGTSPSEDMLKLKEKGENVAPLWINLKDDEDLESVASLKKENGFFKAEVTFEFITVEGFSQGMADEIFATKAVGKVLDVCKLEKII